MAGSIDWTTIKRVALELGVSGATVDRWRSRGWVPHAMRLPMIRQAALPLDFEFGEPDLKRAAS